MQCASGSVPAFVTSVRLTFASGLALFSLLQQLFLELSGPGSVVVVTSLVQLFY